MIAFVLIPTGIPSIFIGLSALLIAGLSELSALIGHGGRACCCTTPLGTYWLPA